MDFHERIARKDKRLAPNATPNTTPNVANDVDSNTTIGKSLTSNAANGEANANFAGSLPSNTVKEVGLVSNKASNTHFDSWPRNQERNLACSKEIANLMIGTQCYEVDHEETSKIASTEDASLFGTLANGYGLATSMNNDNKHTQE